MGNNEYPGVHTEFLKEVGVIGARPTIISKQSSS